MKTFGDIFKESILSGERKPFTIYVVNINYEMSSKYLDTLKSIEVKPMDVYVNLHRSTIYNEIWYTMAKDKHATSRYQDFDFRGKNIDNETQISYMSKLLFSCKEAYDEWLNGYINTALEQLNVLHILKNEGVVRDNEGELETLAKVLGYKTYKSY